MLLVVVKQHQRLGKRHDRDDNATAGEFSFPRAHLAEVSLTGQSSEMAEEDKQQVLIEIRP